MKKHLAHGGKVNPEQMEAYLKLARTKVTQKELQKVADAMTSDELMIVMSKLCFQSGIKLTIK